MKSFGITPGNKVLDLGCGDGTTALPVGPKTKWVGLQRMYDLAWARDALGPQARIRDA